MSTEKFSRHQDISRRHVLRCERVDGGLRRRRRDEGPRPAAGGSPAAGGPGRQDELEIEKKWLVLARIDREEFGRFFEKYHRPVLSYIQHRVGDPETAEDLLSETFLEAVSSLWRFRFQGLTFDAWLFRLARRRIAKHFARRRQRGEVPFAEEDHDRSIPAEVVAGLEAEQDAQLLALCLRQLDDTGQDLVVLHHFEGLSLAQVAVIVGEDETNVKARLYRARRKLARLLADPEIRGRLTREGRRALDELRGELGQLQVVDGAGEGS